MALTQLPNYPDNVVQFFVKEAAKGIDVFRVFDSLNWVENMRVAMDAVVESGKICEGTICYTGDILDPERAKYDVKYYVGMAKELEAGQQAKVFNAPEGLGRWGLMLHRWHTRRALLQLTDDELRDVGLSSEQARIEGRKAFWKD
mgnify:CR=1 FL=1